MHAARPSLLVLKGKRGSVGGGEGAPSFLCFGKTRNGRFSQNRKKSLITLRHKVCRGKGEDKHTLAHTHTYTNTHEIPIPHLSAVLSADSKMKMVNIQNVYLFHSVQLIPFT